jgi:hypothetical protein
MFGDAVLARLDRIWPNEALLAGQGGPPGSPEAAPAGSILPKTVSVISGGRDAKSPPWVVLVSRRHAAAEEGVAAPEITVEPGHGAISHATWISLAAACCSGLVLYSIKHRTTVMDAEIGRSFRATKAAHDSTAILKVEWAALNEPTRLQTMASQYLTLKATIPSQFVALTDLPGKLPAPGTIIPGPMPPVIPLKAGPPPPARGPATGARQRPGRARIGRERRAAGGRACATSRRRASIHATLRPSRHRRGRSGNPRAGCHANARHGTHSACRCHARDRGCAGQPASARAHAAGQRRHGTASRRPAAGRGRVTSQREAGRGQPANAIRRAAAAACSGP